MKPLATGMSTMLVILVLGLELTATASALPEQHMSLGDSYPFTVVATATASSIYTLSTALSAPLTSSSITSEIQCTSLGSLCPYTAELTGAKLDGKDCSTAGDASGVVLYTKNEVHFVSTQLSPLDLAADYLFAKLTITCVKGAETLKMTLEGNAIGKITGVTSGVDITSFTVNLKCTKPGNGKQEVKEYFNSEGKLVKGTLTANLGLGSETACAEVKEPVTAKGAKMFEFLF